MYNTLPSSLIGDPSQAFASHSLDMTLAGQLSSPNLRSFNSSVHGEDSSVFRVLASASLLSQSEGFLSEYSSYGTTSMPMDFYDPASQINMKLQSCIHDSEYDVFSGMEDLFGRRQGESSTAIIGSRRRKAAVMSGLEDFGTQKNEKQRRERLGMKFELLKSLIPNPTKPDRATIISDTINYIKELLRTLNELKLCAGKKGGKYSRTRKIEEDEVHRDMESPSIKSILDEESGHGQNGITKCQWIQKRSPSTFVDVRTIENEVYITLHQIKRIDCPLIVSRVLDELQLEMIHLSGGNIGNYSIFMISSKANERSPVHASSVASKFIEAMDGIARRRSGAASGSHHRPRGRPGKQTRSSVVAKDVPAPSPSPSSAVVPEEEDGLDLLANSNPSGSRSIQEVLERA